MPLRPVSPALDYYRFKKDFIASYTRQSKEEVETRIKTFVIHFTEGLGRRRKIKLPGSDLTPIDTGAARANYNISIGFPDGTVHAPYLPPDPTALVDSYKAGQTIYIVNNLGYVALLNSPDTPSKQASPGFINRNIIRASLIAGLDFTA